MSIKQTAEGWWIIEGDSHISKWVEESKRLDHDQWMLSILKYFIKPGDVVVDAGANIGDHTLAYAQFVDGHGKVVAFELHPEAYQCLHRNLAAYGDRVLALNIGLSNKVEKVNLKTIGDNIGATHAETNEAGLPMESLDFFELKALNFIKMDIEGYELFALQGAKETINRCKPILCLEINPDALSVYNLNEKDLLEYVKGLGYFYMVMQNPKPPEGVQYDILAFPYK